MSYFYETDLTTIHNGDCIKVMNGMYLDEQFVDLVITSPPYNNSRQSGSMKNHEVRYDIHMDNMTNEEYSLWLRKIFNCYDKVLNKNGCVTFNISYGSENTEAMFLAISQIITYTKFTIADVIIWKKKSALPNNVSPNKTTRITEFIFVLCRKEEFKTFNTNKKVESVSKTGQKIYENVFNFINAKNNDESNDLNKATFSSDLVHSLLDRYYVGGIVLDNFSGTATTSFACQERNIKSIGIELSTKQCEYSVNRLRNTQTRLF
jgi:DNA modification methylase